MSKQVMDEVLSGKSQTLNWTFKSFDGTRLETQLEMSPLDVNGDFYIRVLVKVVSA